MGFLWDSFERGAAEPQRLRLTVTAENPTEGATLRIFKRRMGLPDTIQDGMYGQLILDEPAPPADVLPETKAR